MRTLYLDCGMGAAGDMLTAALLELLPNREAFLHKLNALGIPGVTMTTEKAVKCGITGTHFRVMVHGQEEDEHLHDHSHEHHGHREDHSHGENHSHFHDHEHEHGHEHIHTHTHEHPHTHTHGHEDGHHHGSLHEIHHILSHLPLTDRVREDVLSVYRLIAKAESQVHGVPISDIHFHEVGTMDALADITAVCMLMEELQPEQVIASAVHVGCGAVRCAHGILPVPAPATALILQDVPIYGGRIDGELCTPTGAALLKHFVNRFGDMPTMRVASIGYGMGKKDFPKANCVRAMLGQTAAQADSVVELSCNVDDMTAEAMGFALEQFMEEGALDAFTSPIGMKKSRPGTLIRVLCRIEDKEKMAELMFRHTSTLGIREQTMNRYTLERKTETVDTPYGQVRRKVSSGYGVKRVKYEYADLSRIAKERGVGLEDLIWEFNP